MVKLTCENYNICRQKCNLIQVHSPASPSGTGTTIEASQLRVIIRSTGFHVPASPRRTRADTAAASADCGLLLILAHEENCGFCLQFRPGLQVIKRAESVSTSLVVMGIQSELLQWSLQKLYELI